MTHEDMVAAGAERERQARERLERAEARAEEDRARAADLPEGPQRERYQEAAATHERAAALHAEAVDLQRLHQEHEAQRAEDGD